MMGQLPMEENQSSIVSRLFAYAFERPTPLFVTFELTLNCNLKCVHCYNFDRAKPMPKEIKDLELTPAEILKTITELAEAGALSISFSGGEALLHPHLLDFVRKAREHSMAVRIKSNGMLLTEDRVRNLLEAGASDVDVSMYGASAEIHDAFTTKSGSFAKTKAGAETAHRLGLKPKISFILHRENASQVGAMIQMAADLGVDYDFSSELTARYDGTVGSTDHRITEAQIREIFSGPFKDSIRDLKNSQKDIRCACAKAVCGISSTGNVYPCIGAPVRSGNLREQSFAEIWEHSAELNQIRNLEMTDFKKCYPCADRAFCQRSSGASFANTGDYTGADPWVCMEARTYHEIHAENEELETKF